MDEQIGLSKLCSLQMICSLTSTMYHCMDASKPGKATGIVIVLFITDQPWTCSIMVKYSFCFLVSNADACVRLIKWMHLKWSFASSGLQATLHIYVIFLILTSDASLLDAVLACMQHVLYSTWASETMKKLKPPLSTDHSRTETATASHIRARMPGEGARHWSIYPDQSADHLGFTCPDARGAVCALWNDQLICCLMECWQKAGWCRLKRR